MNRYIVKFDHNNKAFQKEVSAGNPVEALRNVLFSFNLWVAGADMVENISIDKIADERSN